MASESEQRRARRRKKGNAPTDKVQWTPPAHDHTEITQTTVIHKRHDPKNLIDDVCADSHPDRHVLAFDSS